MKKNLDNFSVEGATGGFNSQAPVTWQPYSAVEQSALLHNTHYYCLLDSRKTER